MPIDAQLLKRIINNDNTLTKLDLHRNNLGAEGAKALSAVFEKNQTLTQVNLSFNEIGTEGVRALAAALEKNQTLTQVDLSNNEIGVEGAKALATALEKNQTLTQVNLSYNEIGTEGVRALAAALEKNQTLTQVGLSNNEIGVEGAKALAAALEKNQTLTQVNLSDNKIGVEGARALAAALEKNQTLIEADFHTNNIGDEGAKALSLALAKNQTLTQIDLAHNKIGSEGAKALVVAIEKNQTLTELELTLNNLGAQFEQKISKKIEANLDRAEALLEAAEAGDLSKVKALVIQGVALNYQDYPGNTALHYATLNHHQEIVNFLLAQPHQVMLRNKKGELPKDITAVKSQPLKQQPVIQKPIIPFGNRPIIIQPQPVKPQPRAIIPIAQLVKPAVEPPKPIVALNISYTIPYADLTFSLDSNKQPIKLGEGSFGAVYKGTWHFVDVAIKKLHVTTMTEKALQEFKQETEVMAKLTHPHVIRLYGACIEPDKYSMVMEYMPKGSLYNVLHSLNPPDWTVRWKIALDIGKGIYHLHSKNILHRDLKSLNVLMDNQYTAKVSDFGLSLVKTETASKTNHSASQAVGTLPWMAPELFNNEKYTQKADIYSYGMILWELASCKNPYANFMAPFLMVMYVQQGKREEIPKDTPPSYARLIAKCWAQRAEERPTIEEVVKELSDKQSEANIRLIV